MHGLALLAPSLVLTARHCVAENPDEVICGVTTFGATDPPEIHRVTPDWDGPEKMDFAGGHWFGAQAVSVTPGSALCGYDLALLRLAGAGIGAELATPLWPRLDAAPVAGEPYRAVGFGATGPGSEGLGRRRERTGNSVECVGDCPAWYLDNEREWEGGAGTCLGDSGGPALDAQDRAIGVSSRSDPDCTGDIYGGLWTWADWIRAEAVAAAEAGGYEPPAWAGGAGPPDGGAGGAAGSGPGSGAQDKAAGGPEPDDGSCAVRAPARPGRTWLAALAVAALVGQARRRRLPLTLATPRNRFGRSSAHADLAARSCPPAGPTARHGLSAPAGAAAPGAAGTATAAVPGRAPRRPCPPSSRPSAASSAHNALIFLAFSRQPGRSGAQ